MNSACPNAETASGETQGRGGGSAIPGNLIHIATLVFEGVFGVFTLYAAYSLFMWTPPTLAKAGEAMGMPRWFWLLAGTVATVGAAALFTGLVDPVVGALAALWMVAYFVVASMLRIARNDLGNIAPALVFLALAILLAALRWSDLTPALALIGR